ncbi:dTDP-4-dehydrorhamnose reductase [Rhodovarius crocodyli]|uniref:dTDP-4-dehydrorhamnose reductase n=1 Tax=Rhodovarius crocodyli TaxID=1979269 RepID=A0A437MFH5_9PROT|nr:dTDP-4-dehydrorhamnose reductase [Rhodovarius crocodyli]RVT96389.1 dTDP-4-dehydrorhamnose reductase [Rhodovarius crocodyli]
MKRILVTGKGGQLATGLLDALPAMGFEPMAVGQPEFEFDKPETVEAAFRTLRPDAVVNCAAWTAVDAAEEDEPGAFRANALGPALLGRLTAEAGIPLIQISTDYVYDGQKPTPYVETDEPRPVGAYGRTKLAGEWAALAANPQTVIMRTAWVVSPVGKNFVKTMLAVGASRPELKVVADQWGNPTAAPDLADAIAKVLARLRETGWQERYRGVFHATNAGHVSWHGFAEAIFEAASARGGPKPVVHAITTAEYPTKAVRPANSQLVLDKLRDTFGIEMPSWQQGLNRVLDKLLS